MRLKNISINDAPLDYEPSDQLVNAAEVAYALKRPLLVSGEPGTGKTDFAHWVAATLAASDGFAPDPVIFNTKSTSIAQDLFYYYDAIAHFRDARIQGLNDRTAADYIELRALGLAFENARQGKGTVVLIDEVDKAPRDFPNDLLNELDRYEFEIKELNQVIQLNREERKKILIILTSNFEKNLPEAFLRRCIYFHIDFPGGDQLTKIVKRRLDISDPFELDLIGKRVGEFLTIRKNENIQKKPATSECLDYVRVLKNEGKLGSTLLDDRNKATPEGLAFLPLILKKKEDRDLYIPKIPVK